ncbi:hypothetical protein, partial [Enterobacter hormaechei]|uniref:hypothetical protein n=1 Tax=Enterobacter hormaechei TaxID=158836 RepID=UPI003D36DF44
DFMTWMSTVIIEKILDVTGANMNRWVIRACALISVLSLLSGQSEYPGYMFWLSSAMILVWIQTEWSDYKKIIVHDVPDSYWRAHPAYKATTK